MVTQGLQGLQDTWFPQKRKYRWFNHRYLAISTTLFSYSNKPYIHETNTIFGGLEMILEYIDEIIISWVTQNIYDLTGQILLFEFVIIGMMVLHTEWRDSK